MKKTTDISAAAATMGRKGGAAKSAAKAQSSRANGKKGGRKIKFHISSQTLGRLAEAARNEAESGVGQQDWDAKSECRRVAKIADELGMVGYHDGRIELSREAFDWVIATLDWICSDYYNNC